jgi:hypothetical protein
MYEEQPAGPDENIDQFPISSINATTVDSTPARTERSGSILNNGE